MTAGLYRRLVFGLLAVYWVAIFVATHLPTLPEAVDLSQVSDKTLHYGAYTGFGFLLSASLAVGGWSWRRAVLGLLIVAVYGVVDELLQISVNREADAVDWLADMVGGLTGIAVFSVLRAVFRRRNED